MELLELPPEFSVLSVMWQEERHAFCIFVQAPPMPEFFVPQNEIIPVQAAAVTVTDDGSGARRIRIAIPQLKEFMAVMAGTASDAEVDGR